MYQYMRVKVHFFPILFFKLQYWSYQYEVNSLKKITLNKKKNLLVWGLWAIYSVFQLNQHVQRLQNHCCMTWWLFYESCKNVVSQSQNDENQKSFEVSLRVWGHNEYVWGQRSIPGHVLLSEVTMNRLEVWGREMKKWLKYYIRSQIMASDLMHIHRDLTA